MIPCKTCGRNAEFCDCARRCKERRRDVAFYALLVIHFTCGYMAAVIIHNYAH